MTNDKLELLTKPLPPEAITQHPTKTFLSSIKGIYVTERFNEVFGVGKWRVKVEHVTTEKKKETSKVGDMVVVKVIFEVPEHNIYYEAYGGNNNDDLGDAFKGAMTDGMTKIGSWLGVGIDVYKGKTKHAKAETFYPKKTETPAQPVITVAEEEIPF
jgi:hypothetical protein